MARTLMEPEILLAISQAMRPMSVARDDPHHAQRAHQRGQRVDDLREGAVRDVLEVALERGQKLDVVLGFEVALLELAKLEAEARQQLRLDLYSTEQAVAVTGNMRPEGSWLGGGREQTFAQVGKRNRRE
eukprot:1118683-Pleurochrysis_carterae.AAC.1